MEGVNQRNAAIASFLKGVGNTGKNIATTTYNTASYYTGNTFSSENGSYILRVFFFLFLYLFVAFVLLVVVHFTIHPIFRLKPGAKGFIPIPGRDEDIVYLTKREVPVPNVYYPKDGDKFGSAAFLNNFTISVDMFVRRLPNTNAYNRVVLFKAPPSALNIPAPTVPEGGRMNIDRFLDHMANYTSMIMYLTDTNDLSVTFFCGNGIQYSIPYIKNVPLYTPFRVTIVVQDNMFIVYLNARQFYQRIIPGGITNNFRTNGSVNKFFVAPEWANLPTQTVFLHNLHIWNRPLLFKELSQALPALAAERDFGMPNETAGGEGSVCLG